MSLGTDAEASDDSETASTKEWPVCSWLDVLAERYQNTSRARCCDDL